MEQVCPTRLIQNRNIRIKPHAIWFSMANTLQPGLLLHDFGLPNHLLDTVPLNLSMIHIWPPLWLVVLAVEPQATTGSADWMCLVTLLSSKTTSVASYTSDLSVSGGGKVEIFILLKVLQRYCAWRRPWRLTRARTSVARWPSRGTTSTPLIGPTSSSRIGLGNTRCGA